jgi:FKBP-type peptidyl-prolyl cis-trans isomerase
MKSVYHIHISYFSSSLFLFLGLFLFLLSGCGSRYEGFSHVDEEVYVKLNRFGESELQVKDAHYSEWHVTLGLLREESFTYETEFGLGQKDNPFVVNSTVQLVLGKRVAYDSLELRLPYKAIKSGLLDGFSVDEMPVADTVMMQLRLNVIRTLDSLQYLAWRTEQIRKQEAEEQAFIKAVLADRNLLTDFEYVEGIYFKKLSETEGKSVESGDDITLGLTGCFLNDSIFDVARDSANYLYFQYGKPDQVVKGIELALSKMREGEQSRVYCPSYLAFGHKGSRGIVPPNTSVYFDLELVRIGLHPSLREKDQAD